MLLNSRKNSGYIFQQLDKWIGILTVAVFPLFSGIVLGLVYAYHKGITFALAINARTSSRLELAANAFDKYGLTLFGKHFEMIGYGGSTYLNPNYNFIDNSYALILIRYGIVTLVLIGLLWSLTTYKAVISGDRRLAMGMALIAFHSISEHHFMEINYNILLLIPFAFYPPVALFRRKSSEESPDEVPLVSEPMDSVDRGSARPDYLSVLSILTVICLIGFLFFFAFPGMISWIRTLCSIWQVKSYVWKRAGLLLAVLLILVVFTCLFYSIYHIVDRILHKKKPAIIAIACLSVCLLTILGGYMAADHIIGHSTKTYADDLEATAPAIKTILQEKDTKLYVDKIPELFQRRYGGVTPSVFTGDEMARYKNITVITEDGFESACLLNNGYLYGQISSEYAVYTDNPSVINRLTEAGYHLTGYYSKKKKVDLEDMAELNDLSLSEDGSLNLSGTDKEEAVAPDIDLRAGNYTIKYKLALTDSMLKKNLQPDDPVCTLQITSFAGENVLLELPVTRSQFSKKGNCTAVVTCYIPESQDVRFQIMLPEESSVILKGISFQQTPEYDIHKFYNDKHQIIREEYYDLDGNRVVHAGGYSACEYGYDNQDNINLIRYYDDNDRLIMTDMGYASVRKTYDVKHQVIKESFYDTGDNPAILPSGQAAQSYDYDEKGNMIGIHYLDTNDLPMTISDNYSQIRRIFNDNRQIIEESYLDIDSNMVPCSAGYAVKVLGYDTEGNETVQQYLDRNRKPVLSVDGFAKVVRTFDANRHVIKEEYFDTEDRPVLCAGGYASVIRDYDPSGNITEEKYYDTDGNIITR